MTGRRRATTPAEAEELGTAIADRGVRSNLVQSAHLAAAGPRRLLGRPLQLIHYDDGGDASKANAFGKRLVEDDNVDFIVGGYWRSF